MDSLVVDPPPVPGGGDGDTNSPPPPPPFPRGPAGQPYWFNVEVLKRFPESIAIVSNSYIWENPIVRRMSPTNNVVEEVRRVWWNEAMTKLGQLADPNTHSNVQPISLRGGPIRNDE